MEISSSPRGNLILELSQCAPRWLKCHFHPPQSAPPPLHRFIFNHHPLQPTWLFLLRFLISLQIWAAFPHLARGCVVLFSLFRFFARPFSFSIWVSSFSFSVSISPNKSNIFSDSIFPSPTKMSSIFFLVLLLCTIFLIYFGNSEFFTIWKNIGILKSNFSFPFYQWCWAAILSHSWHIATLISFWDEAQPQCGLARWSSGRGPELWKRGKLCL